ncbi:MAG: hypothetical protein COB62_07455 [Piscirickettsiaceae bacterium]|nr:MAG: hypothetical protein COB62_07455 [Piscirickettsiaceae bacterium]
MKKILQILPSDSPGILQLAQSIEHSFPSKNFTVTTAFLNQTSNPYISGTAKFFNFKKNETKGLRIKALWAIYKYCRQERFDVIITHRFKPFYLILIISKFLQIPMCISVIHGFGDFSRGSRRLLLKILWSDNWHFVAISNAVASYLVGLSPQIGKNEVTTINNAINVAEQIRSFKTKQQSRLTMGLKEPPITFGTIGRLIPLKGHINLIKAFEIVLKTQPNSHLVIVGEGRCRSELENYLSTHNLKQNITLTGHLDSAANYIKAFDIFILPSLTEGFGMVLLEAMAAKLPIIASNTGGIPNVLGDCGQLVPPDISPHDLANVMLEKSSLTTQERQQEGEALYKRLLNQFDELVYQKKWLELISQKFNLADQTKML